MWWSWLLVPLGYLAGSIPFGLLVVKASRRIDVRSLGSGKTGMTNVMRAAGKRAALAVLLLDAGKGFVAVTIAKLLTDDAAVHATVATAVIVGHVWPVFAGFHGGRGIATGLGCTLGLFPWAVLPGLALFVPLVAATRYVSLGSVVSVLAVVAAFAAGVTLAGTPPAYLAFAVVGGGLIIWMHRDNIARLIQGTERRIGESPTPLRGAP